MVKRDGGEMLHTHRRDGSRCLVTMFGKVGLTRVGYSRPGQPGIFPLDGELALPARSFSHQLQRGLVKAVSQNPFQESVQSIAELVGVPVAKRSLEGDCAGGGPGLRRLLPVAPPETLLQPDSGGRRRLQGHPLSSPAARSRHSGSKGHKANRKRMATVAVVFTRQPWVRTPEQVAASLFHKLRSDPDSPAPRRPENKRVWASLTKGKAAAIATRPAP